MKKLAYTAFASIAAMALAACGSSDKAKEDANVENVEMPAEEAVGAADADATPVADASEAASGEASALPPAAETATKEAEKKM